MIDELKSVCAVCTCTGQFQNKVPHKCFTGQSFSNQPGEVKRS